MSKERYKPTPEEIKKAEDTMMPEQKRMSEERNEIGPEMAKYMDSIRLTGEAARLAKEPATLIRSEKNPQGAGWGDYFYFIHPLVPGYEFVWHNHHSQGNIMIHYPNGEQHGPFKRPGRGRKEIENDIIPGLALDEYRNAETAEIINKKEEK